MFKKCLILKYFFYDRMETEKISCEHFAGLGIVIGIILQKQFHHIRVTICFALKSTPGRATSKSHY